MRDLGESCSRTRMQTCTVTTAHLAAHRRVLFIAPQGCSSRSTAFERDSMKPSQQMSERGKRVECELSPVVVKQRQNRTGKTKTQIENILSFPIDRLLGKLARGRRDLFFEVNR